MMNRLSLSGLAVVLTMTFSLTAQNQSQSQYQNLAWGRPPVPRAGGYASTTGRTLVSTALMANTFAAPRVRTSLNSRKILTTQSVQSGFLVGSAFGFIAISISEALLC